MNETSSTTSTIRVLLADDHDILRQGLKLLLGMQPEMEIVGEARTGLEAVEMAHELKPDVVVMDITMAGMDGLEACQRIRSQISETQVLMLTMHESEEYFLQALRMGAAGYLIKKVAPTELHMAIRAVARGGAFLYPGLAKALIRAYVADSPAIAEKSLRSQERAEAANLAQELRVLTPREVEVLTLVAEGRTNQEIANQLVLSVKTVQAHRANVMEKLGLHDVTHLVRFAIRHGLIPAEL
ncbi:MAG: response regulator [Ktedonobacteraceae bacterium]